MEAGAARGYLRRIAAVHVAGVLWTLGSAVAALGAPAVGVPLILLATLVWTVGIALAWAVAVKRREGKPWFGARSVMEDANEQTGWGRIPEAAEALGRNPQRIISQVRSAVLGAGALLLVAIIAAVV